MLYFITQAGSLDLDVCDHVDNISAEETRNCKHFGTIQCAIIVKLQSECSAGAVVLLLL